MCSYFVAISKKLSHLPNEAGIATAELTATTAFGTEDLLGGVNISSITAFGSSQPPAHSSN